MRGILAAGVSLLFLTQVITAVAQSHKKGWHLQHRASDTCLGIGLEDALQTLKQPENAESILVAVIDDGVDTEHPDLKDRIWVNPGEIPGNGLDDDGNGYTDDTNGWDFLGSSSQDIEYDNTELTRLVRDYRKRFGKGAAAGNRQDNADYKRWKSLERIHGKRLKEAEKDLKTMRLYKRMTDALLYEIGHKNIRLDSLQAHKTKNIEVELGADIVKTICKKEQLSPAEVFDIIEEEYQQTYNKVQYHLNTEFDPRPEIGDNYADARDKAYGNSEVKGPDGKHGSHVAGIIAAVRNNGTGMDGISSLVKIMVLRVVPNGDERDKDVALAIRYAADNGARVINMSFGKDYAFDAGIVREAIRYAEMKDVLMVHAAGNDHQNNDKAERYPSEVYSGDSMCKTWIEVGASDRDMQAASFSNYGRKTVHVFAPGVQIYSSVTDSSYAFYDGTSMAAPVVSGLAALIRSWYPHLTALQVKHIIESTVLKPQIKTRRPGSKKRKTRYKKLCSSAGIIQAENALKAAAAIPRP